MFRIVRIDSPFHGSPELLCSDPEQAAQVTLFNDITGKEETIQLCWNTTDVRPCTLLNQLTAAGFTPNDWATECPA